MYFTQEKVFEILTKTGFKQGIGYISEYNGNTYHQYLHQAKNIWISYEGDGHTYFGQINSDRIPKRITLTASEFLDLLVKHDIIYI